MCADDIVFTDEVKADSTDITNRCLHPTRYDNSWTTAWNETTDIPIFDVPSGFTMMDVVRNAINSKILKVQRNPEAGWDWLEFAKDLGEGDAAQTEFYLEEFKKDRVKIKRDARGRFVASDLMFPLKPPSGCVQGDTRHTISATTSTPST